MELPTVADERVVGGKAAGLAVLQRLGLPVPRTWVIPTYVSDEHPPVPTDLSEEVASLMDKLSPGASLAVRSSAVSESARDRATAGMFATFLDLRSVADIAAAIEGCWLSAGATGTRQQSMAVILQEFVRADAAGACQASADLIEVEAVAGLGVGLMSGVVTPDQFLLRPDGSIVEQRL